MSAKVLRQATQQQRCAGRDRPCGCKEQYLWDVDATGYRPGVENRMRAEAPMTITLCLQTLPKFFHSRQRMRLPHIRGEQLDIELREEFRYG